MTLILRAPGTHSEAFEVEVMVNDRSVAPVKMEYVLLIDKALTLGIMMISAREGLWCLRDGLGRVSRVSYQLPQ